MAKETVGYVHLEWTCDACGSKNAGVESKCTSCGAPQPEDVQFEQVAQETLIRDEKAIDKAKKGPDIHCPFCGTRNPAGSSQCRQCMADLAEGTARETGQVVGSHQTEAAADVACPFCDTMNPATARKCANCGGNLAEPETKPRPAAPPKRAAGKATPIIFAVIGLILVGVCLLMFLSTRTEEITGRVTDVTWTRMVNIEAQVPVQKEAWIDQIPGSSAVGACRQEVRRVQDDPAPNSDKVCGTPYTVDTGTGIGEVVQDCVYQVYDDLCQYEVNEWRIVDQATLKGNDLAAVWPEPSLSTNQRPGGRSEEYAVRFDVDGQPYIYRTTDVREFAAFAPDSRWSLEVNTFDSVVSVSPAE